MSAWNKSVSTLLNDSFNLLRKEKNQIKTAKEQNEEISISFFPV